MSGGMIGGMEQESDDRRGCRGPADGSRLGEGRYVGRRELLKPPLDRLVQRAQQGIRARRRLRKRSFARQVGALTLGQRFAARVGQEAVGGAREMSHVKAHGRDTRGPRPNFIRGHPEKRAIDIFPRRDERVGHRLKKGRDSLDRAPEPGVGSGGRGAHATVPRKNDGIGMVRMV
jgi:hypothetical protein